MSDRNSAYGEEYAGEWNESNPFGKAILADRRTRREEAFAAYLDNDGCIIEWLKSYADPARAEKTQEILRRAHERMKADCLTLKAPSTPRSCAALLK